MRLRIILLLAAGVLVAVVFFFLQDDPGVHIAEPDFRQALRDESPAKIQLFPQIAVAGALAEDSTGTSSKVQHFACSMLDFATGAESTPENAETQIARHRERIDRIAGQLSASGDAEHLLMAGILGSSDTGNRYDRQQIQKAVALDPDNAQFTWHLLQACTHSGHSGDCDPADIEDRAIRVDGENAALWASIAVRRAKREDEAGAFEALRLAITAPGFNSFFVDDLMLFERGLAATTDQSYSERAMFAIGVVAASSSVSADIHRVCEPRLESSSEWRSLCLQMAQRIEHAGETILEVQIALGTQKLIHKSSGMDDRWSEANRRAERHREEMKLGWASDIQLVLTVDDRVMAAYVDEWAAHGELAAIRFSHEETERLKTLPGYDPCAQLEKLARFREPVGE